MALFGLALVVGVGYAGAHLVSDLQGVKSTSVLPFLLLEVALLIALGFEFVNGFHDTANAVATVIYTHTLDPHVAVLWPGIWNFFIAGRTDSSGRKPSGIRHGLRFACRGDYWNLGTRWLGLPSSSSHTLIGSVIGVGIANQLMAANTGTSGVDWGQAANIGRSLLLSPLVGFVCAALLLLLTTKLVPDKRLYKAPEGTAQTTGKRAWAGSCSSSSGPFPPRTP